MQLYAPLGPVKLPTHSLNVSGWHVTLHHVAVHDSHMARLHPARNPVLRLEVRQILTVGRANCKSVRLQMLDPFTAAAACRALVHLDRRFLLLLANERRDGSDQ